jgi:hypothetical protein
LAAISEVYNDDDDNNNIMVKAGNVNSHKYHGSLSARFIQGQEPEATATCKHRFVFLGSCIVVARMF